VTNNTHTYFNCNILSQAPIITEQCSTASVPWHTGMLLHSFRSAENLNKKLYIQTLESENGIILLFVTRIRNTYKHTGSSSIVYSICVMFCFHMPAFLQSKDYNIDTYLQTCIVSYPFIEGRNFVVRRHVPLINWSVLRVKKFVEYCPRT
jgi:hypothetical protein